MSTQIEEPKPWSVVAQVGGTPRGKFYRVKHPESNSVLVGRTIRGKCHPGPQLCNPDPTIATVIAKFEHNHESYVVYDVPACYTLYEVLKTSLVPFERGLRIALQVADALRALHRSGRVHGLLSTEAVLLFSDDRIAAIDYSIPALWEAVDEPGELAFIEPTLPNLATRDESSDIYSYGVLLYMLATGFLPFTPETQTDLTKRAAKAPPPIGKRSSTWGFEAFSIVNSCLSLDRSQRPKSAAELRNRLAKLSPTPIQYVDENEVTRAKARASQQLRAEAAAPRSSELTSKNWTGTISARLKIAGLIILAGLIAMASLALRSLATTMAGQ